MGLPRLRAALRAETISRKCHSDKWRQLRHEPNTSAGHLVASLGLLALHEIESDGARLLVAVIAEPVPHAGKEIMLSLSLEVVIAIGKHGETLDTRDSIME